MSRKKGVVSCPHNQGVECQGPGEKCAECGWNPTVMEARLQDQRDTRRAERTVEGWQLYTGKVAEEPLYQVWRQTRNKCYDPSHPGYENYGAKGIGMCQSWKYSLVEFVNDMGPRPKGYVLGRRDMNGDFNPSNCEWIPVGESRRRMNQHRKAGRQA